MSTADLPISRLMVEVVPDQARSLVFTDLLSLTSTVVGDWTAVVPVGAVSLAVAADGNDLVVSWSGAQARSTLGRAWRLRLDGVDVVGGRVVEALPQSVPGVSSVSVSVSPSVSVSVDVSVLPVGPVGPVGATGATGATGAPGADGADAVYSDATPAALGTAAPGTADLAAREGHVHPMPTPGEVGADPAGTAAGLVAAYEPNIPHIEMTVSQPGGPGTDWRLVVPTPLRSAVFVPPFTVGLDDPTGTFDGVEVPAPSGTDDPRWWLVAPVSGNGSEGVYLFDPTDHGTVTGLYSDQGAGSSSTIGAAAGLAVVPFVVTGGGTIWVGGATADSAVFASLPDLVAGDGIDLTPAGDTLVVSTQGPVITDFTSSGSFAAVAGAKMYEVIAWGGGGGGGSGRKGAEGSARFGGCGGCGGSWLRVMLPASALTFPITVTIGAGGAGAASVTTDSTNGNNGTTGGSTSFGSYVTVMGGYGGLGGQATAATFYSSQPSGAPVGQGGLNGVGSLTIDVLPVPGGMHGAAGGGGGGGWRNAANTSAIIFGIGGLGTGALTPPSGNGAAGIAATAPLGGTGGNGGTTGTTGGAGGFIAGGGGGGGAGINGTPGTASGAGGAGAKGWLRVIAYR